MLNDLAKTLKTSFTSISESTGISKQSTLRDMMTDLRHVAKDMDLDFDFAVEGSEEVFLIEDKEN